MILPAVAHHVFGRPYYWPIFEAAQRNDLVVAFHQSGGTRTAVGLPPYYIEWPRVGWMRSRPEPWGVGRGGARLRSPVSMMALSAWRPTPDGDPQDELRFDCGP